MQSKFLNYWRHYKLRLVYLLTHFSLRFVINYVLNKKILLKNPLFNQERVIMARVLYITNFWQFVFREKMWRAIHLDLHRKLLLSIYCSAFAQS